MSSMPDRMLNPMKSPRIPPTEERTSKGVILGELRNSVVTGLECSSIGKILVQKINPGVNRSDHEICPV